MARRPADTALRSGCSKRFLNRLVQRSSISTSGIITGFNAEINLQRLKEVGRVNNENLYQGVGVTEDEIWVARARRMSWRGQFSIIFLEGSRKFSKSIKEVCFVNHQELRGFGTADYTFRVSIHNSFHVRNR